MSDPAIPIPDFAGLADDPRRQEFDQLRETLRARQSVTHITRAAVAFLVALPVTSAGGKLAYDSPKYAVAGYGLVALGVSLIVFSALSLFHGRRIMRKENALYARLKTLRSELNLDDPASLLPKE